MRIHHNRGLRNGTVLTSFDMLRSFLGPKGIAFDSYLSTYSICKELKIDISAKRTGDNDSAGYHVSDTTIK